MCNGSAFVAGHEISNLFCVGHLYAADTTASSLKQLPAQLCSFTLFSVVEILGNRPRRERVGVGRKVAFMINKRKVSFKNSMCAVLQLEGGIAVG